MSPNQNASPGPSKRPRADSVESLFAGISTILEHVPSVPKRPSRPVNIGVAVPSARANHQLRELEGGDEWVHVDNRTRRELFAWAWEDMLDGSGELIRAPIAYSGYTVVVGNIKLPEGMEEVDLRRTVYHKFSIHGPIDDLFLFPKSFDNARRVLQVTFAMYPSTVGAIREDGKLRLTNDSTEPCTVRRQMHRPGHSWFVTPKSTLSDRQQEANVYLATNEASRFPLIPELNQVPAPPDEESFKHLPGKFFEDLGYDQFPPELPPIGDLSYRSQIGMRENQRAVGNAIAKMYKEELSEWDEDGYDAKIRSHLGDRLIRPEMTATHEERSYTDNVFGWDGLYDLHSFAWARDQFRYTIPDTPGPVYDELEQKLGLEPKQDTVDFLRSTSVGPWFNSSTTDSLSALERKTAGVSRAMLEASGLVEASDASPWTRLDKVDDLVQAGIEKARNFGGWKQHHKDQRDDPMFPRGYFWSPNREVPTHDWKNKSNLLLNRPLVRPGSHPLLEQPERPISPPAAVAETINADLLKFRAQHGSWSRK